VSQKKFFKTPSDDFEKPAIEGNAKGIRLSELFKGSCEGTEKSICQFEVHLGGRVKRDKRGKGGEKILSTRGLSLVKSRSGKSYVIVRVEGQESSLGSPGQRKLGATGGRAIGFS